VGRQQNKFLLKNMKTIITAFILTLALSSGAQAMDQGTEVYIKTVCKRVAGYSTDVYASRNRYPIEFFWERTKTFRVKWWELEALKKAIPLGYYALSEKEAYRETNKMCQKEAGTIYGKPSTNQRAICDQFFDFTNLSMLLYSSGRFITLEDISKFLETDFSELHTKYPDLSLAEMQTILVFVSDPVYTHVTRLKDYNDCKETHKNGKHPKSLFN
jgi:hypothetical protein